MALKLDQESFLVDLINHIKEDPDPINDWEEGFMADQAERFSKEKSDMWLSGKQMNIVRRIGKNKYGMDWDEYSDSFLGSNPEK